MQELILIGIGTGSPAHLTQEARAAMHRADLILVPHKGEGKSDLADLRVSIAHAELGDAAKLTFFTMPQRDPHPADYHGEVIAWHGAICDQWRAAAGAAQSVALLVWGDPMLYDSTLRIAERLDPQPNITVIPGITAIQALCAAHRIPLNDIGAPVMITTGRQLRDTGFPAGCDSAIFMLDGQCSFQHLPQEAYEIYWGAYLGMDNQILHHGRLSDVTGDIIAHRAAARADHGWIMDIYLLRRLAP